MTIAASANSGRSSITAAGSEVIHSRAVGEKEIGMTTRGSPALRMS